MKLQTYHKLGNLFSGNSLLFQNSPLMNSTATSLSNELRLLAVELSRNSFLRNLGRFVLYLLLRLLLYESSTLYGSNKVKTHTREDGRTTVCLNLVLKLVSSSLDRHTSAVESKRENGVLSLQGVITKHEKKTTTNSKVLPSSKLSLGGSEGMTKVKHTVHVGIRESSHVTRSEYLQTHLLSLTHVFRGINLERLFLFPNGLHFGLCLKKMISSSE